MLNYLRWAALIALGWTLAGLAIQYGFLRARGRRPWAAAAAGSPSRGVAYLFTTALLPWNQDFARRHVPTLLAGLACHLGLLAGFAFLATRLAHLNLPDPLLRACTILCALGTLAAIGLYAKRLARPALKAMSAPDDYISSLLVILFLGTGSACTLSALYDPWFLGAAALLLLYLPVGKLRHVLFFFLARRAVGAQAGHRGLLPPPEGRHV